MRERERERKRGTKKDMEVGGEEGEVPGTREDVEEGEGLEFLLLLLFFLLLSWWWSNFPIVFDFDCYGFNCAL